MSCNKDNTLYQFSVGKAIPAWKPPSVNSLETKPNDKIGNRNCMDQTADCVF